MCGVYLAGKENQALSFCINFPTHIYIFPQPFTMDLARYIEGLSATMMDELYQSQYVCQAILRCLPPLAKQYLFRLLHCPGVPAGQSSLLLAGVCGAECQ